MNAMLQLLYKSDILKSQNSIFYLTRLDIQIEKHGLKALFKTSELLCHPVQTGLLLSS